MIKLKLLFAWYDLWVGLFYDVEKKTLYVFPVPMFGVVVTVLASVTHFAFKVGAPYYLNLGDAHSHIIWLGLGLGEIRIEWPRRPAS